MDNLNTSPDPRGMGAKDQNKSGKVPFQGWHWRRKIITYMPDTPSLTVSSCSLRKRVLVGSGQERRNVEETEYKPKMTKKALKSLDLLEMTASNII